jgi:hypothetical protein
MSNLDIQIEGRDAFRPGEEICGRARWELPKNPKWLEVSLFWGTEGKGNQDRRVAERVRFETPGASGVKDFRLTAPSGPYSFSGTLILIIWWIQLAKLGGKNSVRKKITISSTGREVVYMEQICVSYPCSSRRSLAFRIGRLVYLCRVRLTSRKSR